MGAGNIADVSTQMEQTTPMQPAHLAPELQAKAVPEIQASQPPQSPHIVPTQTVATADVPPVQPTHLPLKPEVTAMVETIVAPTGEVTQLAVPSGVPLANFAQGGRPEVLPGVVHSKQAPRQRHKRAAATAAAKNLQNIIAEEGLPIEVECPHDVTSMFMWIAHWLHLRFCMIPCRGRLGK